MRRARRVGAVLCQRRHDDALAAQHDAAEVACLYVKMAHEGRGYGADLARHAESVAKQKGIHSAFALSNRAATFFLDTMGYREGVADDLPVARREQLLRSGRDSRVFLRQLD